MRRSILLTLAYSDLFDFPLTADELYENLVAPAVARDAFDQALAALVPAQACAVDAYFCLPDREAVVACRAERGARAAARWHHAERFARRLGRVPFLRMVAVCGSQAVDNPGPDGDIDLFLIAAPRRLWLAQAATMILRRLTRTADFCPNYLLTETSLAVEPRNLYAAREVTQAVPLWGHETYRRFLDANRWVEGFLPHHPQDGRRHRLAPPAPSRARRVVETLLRGRVGDLLDRVVYETLIVYYTVRLRRRGWTRKDVRAAYRRDRQVVITGGYMGAVASRFLDRAAVALADEPGTTPDAIETLVADCFWGRDASGTAPHADPLYTGLFARRYGGARG